MVAKTLLILSVLLASTAFSMPTASALLSDVFEIGLSYSNGKVAQKSMQLTKGFMPQAGRMGSGSYGITVISYTGKTLWESGFSFPLEAFAEPDISCYDENFDYNPDLCDPGNPSHVTFESAETVVYAPYYPAADRIDVSSPEGNRVLSIDVSKFSCGNGFCDTKEDLGSCPEDCSADRQLDIFESQQEKINSWLFMVSTIAIIAIVVSLLMYLFVRQRGESIPEVGQF